MVYRIRYRQANGPDDAEVVVEANSPTEAMVKFHHARDGALSQSPCEVVTSVRAEDDCCQFDS